jgi:RES domain-containing protein
MLPARALGAALQRLDGNPYARTLCRAVDAATLYRFQNGGHDQPRPLYSLGPAKNGARFTPRGGAPALYVAEDEQTALHEYRQVGHPAPLEPIAGAGALVLFNVEVRLASVLDVTNAEIQGALATSKEELASPWRYRRAGGVPPTQVLGRAVAQSKRFDAIRFKSTKGPGACLAILTERIVKPAYVRIRDSKNRLVEELP